MEEEMEFSLTWHIQLDSKANDEIWTNTNYLSHIWVAMLEFLCIVYEADPEYEEIKCLNHIKFFAEIKRFESKRMFCENLEFNIGKGVENILNLFINQTRKDEIYTGLKWLTDLNLSQAEISDNDFKTIVSCCKSLSSLSICGCPSITDFGIEHVASMLPQLHTLNVSKASNDCGGNITDYGLETLVKGCPLLTNLNICKCTNVGDFGIFSIATHCHKLTNLDASGCVRVTDESIEALSRKCHNLQILNLDCCVQVSHKSLVNILFNCTKLHKASFENCYKISDEGFKNYSLEIHKLFIKKKMDVLHATRSNVDAFHSHIQKINLSFCSQIGDSFVRELVRLCPDLQSISFCGCYRISDDIVNFTLEHCGGLRYLDISGGSIMQASKLTDASLNHIARQGQNLEVLLMIKNENISVSELMQMIESCFSLKQLQLTCSKSQYESLLKAVSLCSRHVTLDMPEIGGLNPKKRYRCTINIGEFVKSNSTDDLNLQYS